MSTHPAEKPPSNKKTTILRQSAELFAQHGFSAVSMRDLAQKIGLTPAALYYHYPDKEALYLAVLRLVFTDKARIVDNLVAGPESAEIRLRRLIQWLATAMGRDKIFADLLHRELLDGDADRLKLLTTEVIGGPFRALEGLIRELAPERDAGLSAIYGISMIIGYTDLAPIIQNLMPQIKPDAHLATFSNHITALMLHGQIPPLDKAEII